MVKCSTYRRKASRSHPSKAISPVKAPHLPGQATESMLAQKLNSFDPVRHGGEVMASSLVGLERFWKD